MPYLPRVTGGLAVAISLLALVATVGGTSYAAARIAANSVGTAQLKDDAVTTAKVENRTLKAVDLKAGLAKKYVTEIDVVTQETLPDEITIRGIGKMTLGCSAGNVSATVDKKAGSDSNALLAIGVINNNGNAMLEGDGATGYETLFFTGSTNFSATLAVALRGTAAAVHLDLHGVRTGDTCRFSGQIVS